MTMQQVARVAGMVTGVAFLMYLVLLALVLVPDPDAPLRPRHWPTITTTVTASTPPEGDTQWHRLPSPRLTPTN